MSGSLRRGITVSAPDGINSIILHSSQTPACAHMLAQPFAPLAGAWGPCHRSGMLMGCAAAEREALPAPQGLHRGLHLEGTLLSELNCEQPGSVPLQDEGGEPGLGERHKQSI